MKRILSIPEQAPIHAAVSTGSAEKVKALIETPNNRSDINVAARPKGRSPIHVAAEKGFEEVLEVLFSDDSLEPNVDARDSGGQTPLYLAAKGKHGGCVQLLRSKGADLNIRCGNDNLTVRQACSLTLQCHINSIA